MTDTELHDLAAASREKAARIREKWRGMGPSGDRAMHAAAALETCAEDLEAVVNKEVKP